jgi:RNA polymerase primary sigma factor
MYQPVSTIGINLHEIGRVQLLTPEQEFRLATRVRSGDEEARRKMIQANLRLVVKIAGGYRGLGLSMMDLIAEGNLGLIKAVDRFDLGKGAKFSTYAALWIKQAIRRALSNQSRTIRLPRHIVEKIAQLNKTRRELTIQLGRAPMHGELGAKLGVPSAKVAQWQTADIRPIPLDAPIFGDSPMKWGERIGDPNNIPPG